MIFIIDPSFRSKIFELIRLTVAPLTISEFYITRTLRKEFREGEISYIVSIDHNKDEFGFVVEQTNHTTNEVLPLCSIYINKDNPDILRKLGFKDNITGEKK